ncbi:MAG: LON peptidase substrate-binding domain-containing protein [Bacteriovorax sp.]|nr:LON peptidase substrate-binding domain-containing protein [Bacteriovorax sp.]
MKKTVPTLYLLNNIFYPQTIIPLTVTDEISKKLLVSSFQNSTEIALYHPHQRSKGVGTLAKITMLDYNNDGSLNAVIQGLTRIKLLTMHREDPFPQYYMEDYFDFDEKTQTLSGSPIMRLHSILEHWLNRHVNSARERERFMKDISSPVKLINNLCMFVIKDIELKQIFLESTSLLDRVRMMNALLVGNTPDTEDTEMCEAIKSFERLDTDHYKNAS